MKKVLLKITVIALSILFFTSFLGNDVLAQQNVFVCEWVTGSPGFCQVKNDGLSSDPACNYSPGSPNQNYCASLTTQSTCDPAISACQDCPTTTAGYVCSAGSCTSGFSPAPYACAGSQTNFCCLDDSVTPPPATKCWECKTGTSNTCFQRLPNTSGTCDPYWASQSSCVTDCAGASFTSYTCDNAGGGNPTCKGAASGIFTGPTARQDCNLNCTNPPPTPQAIFCDGNGNASNNPADGEIYGLYTGIGCIKTQDTNDLSENVLNLGIGIAGGIALLLIAVAGIMMQTSAGDPRKLQAGRELLSAALIGLLLIVFSAFILRVIGVDILGIPNL